MALTSDRTTLDRSGFASTLRNCTQAKAFCSADMVVIADVIPGTETQPPGIGEAKPVAQAMASVEARMDVPLCLKAGLLWS